MLERPGNTGEWKPEGYGLTFKSEVERPQQKRQEPHCRDTKKIECTGFGDLQVVMSEWKGIKNDLRVTELGN